MNKSEVLITGANGEVGHSLIRAVAEEGKHEIVALDLREPDPKLEALCKVFYRGDILDNTFLEFISSKHRFHTIFHLAGLLSSTGEKNPNLAHMVNVEGSRNIFEIGRAHCKLLGKPVVFVFSSSIAAFGVRPDDDQTKPATERQFLTPATMYGINKLYVEQLGRYYSEFYRKAEEDYIRMDFRSLRFPGLISPDTVPSGGTSDYGPEMLHAAAQNKRYECFVKPDTRMPFMVMSDAIRSLIMLASAPCENLKHRVYNVSSFSVTADQIRAQVLKHFPNAEIEYVPVPARQSIVDSWPKDMDDTCARNDWGWKPVYGFDEAFDSLLVPKVRDRYA